MVPSRTKSKGRPFPRSFSWRADGQRRDRARRVAPVNAVTTRIVRAAKNRRASIGMVLVCNAHRRRAKAADGGRVNMTFFSSSSKHVALAAMLACAGACGSSSSSESSGDAGDAASDAASDAQRLLDVTPLDTPPADANDPNHVKCGQRDVCDLSIADCCARSGGGACIPRGGDCDGYRLTCDGPEDCASGQVCCVNAGGGSLTAVSCVAPEACVGEAGASTASRVCHVDAECTDPSTPHCCFFGLGGVLVGTCHASTCP
jgi:hypothetical protein